MVNLNVDDRPIDRGQHQSISKSSFASRPIVQKSIYLGLDNTYCHYSGETKPNKLKIQNNLRITLFLVLIPFTHIA